MSDTEDRYGCETRPTWTPETIADYEAWLADQHVPEVERVREARYELETGS